MDRNELAAAQHANRDGYVLPVDKKAFENLREGKMSVSPFALNGVWVPFYTQHKVFAGLREAATVDSVTPGYQQPEVEHGLRFENSEVSDFQERKSRLARDRRPSVWPANDAMRQPSGSCRYRRSAPGGMVKQIKRLAGRSFFLSIV